MTMEQRVWISIADMPFADEQRWLPFIELLETSHPQLGPIASWDDRTTMVIALACDEPDRATAAERGTFAVTRALHRSGLSDRFATVFRVEPANDAVAA